MLFNRPQSKFVPYKLRTNDTTTKEGLAALKDRFSSSMITYTIQCILI